MQKIKVFLLLFAALTSCLEADNKRPMPQRPYILMYGYSDNMSSLWAETFKYVNIITGITKNAELVKELKRQGIIFAYHVDTGSKLESESPEALSEYWCSAFKNDLEGKLPGGFDAIAIDEIGSQDGSAESRRICTALRITRENYPDRRIFVWGGWRMGEGGGRSKYLPYNITFDHQLTAVFKYADLFLYERYIREGNPQFYNFVPSANNLELRVPGLLGKTLFGLYISQSDPFVGDDSDKIDFKDFLDEQFYLFANNSTLKSTAGLAFWPFYRARIDVIAHLNQLIFHYFQKDEKGYYGDGDYSQIVKNPGFEQKNNWEYREAQDNSIAIVSYSQVKDVPEKHGPVPHGKRCLKMTRGVGRNCVHQKLFLHPSTWYTLSAFIYLPGGKGEPCIRAYNRDMSILETYKGENSWWYPWRMPVITFKTGIDVWVWIELSDEEIPQGNESYWDFVEIEICRGLNRPLIAKEAVYDVKEHRITITGENFMPGLILWINDTEALSTIWHNHSKITASLNSVLKKGKYKLKIKKPERCLHTHEDEVELSY